MATFTANASVSPTIPLTTVTASTTVEFVQGGTLVVPAPPNLVVDAAEPYVTNAYVMLADPAVLTLTGDLTVSNLMPVDAVTSDFPISIGFDLRATLQAMPPSFNPDDVELITLRLMPQLSVAYPTPIISHGKPVVPAYVGRYGSSMPLIEGPNDIHYIDDPDPVWNPATSGWYYPPPPSGVGDARWTVRDLPDPAGFPGQYYWLGAPSSADGTSGIASACRQWAPNGSTASAPSWQSIFPYKPSVRQHVWYGPSGNIKTITAGVRYNLQFIEHMWLDWGSDIPAPFTWVIVGIIMDFPSRSYRHTVLDVGRSPALQYPGLTDTQLAPDRSLNENIQGNHRPAMFVNETEESVISSWGGSSKIGTPFNHTTRPKMWFAVFNGSKSIAGSYSTSGKYFKGGSLPGTSTRYVITGRQGGYLSRNRASHLVVFEMRFWKKALVEQQLDEQYGQLSSTWKFGDYK